MGSTAAATAANRAGLTHIRGYDSKADVYSAIISSLVMLAGGLKRLLASLPSVGEEDVKIGKKPRHIFREQVCEFLANGPGELGGVWKHPVLQQEQAADFFRRGLCQDPDTRPSAQELLSHPWLAGVGV